MKELLKELLRRCGFSLRRVQQGAVNGIDLPNDLSVVLPQPNPCCIDAGANDGATISLLQRCLRHPRIHAFEPNPEIFSWLRANHSNTPGVNLVNAGLSDADRNLTLYRFSNHALNSFLPLTVSGRGSFELDDDPTRVTVPVQRLDVYAADHALRHIDLLKIDTQGFELHVLRGAESLLRADAVGAVLVELNFAALYEGQASPAAVLAFLDQHHFRLIDFYEKCRRNGSLGWCTALLVHERASS